MLRTHLDTWRATLFVSLGLAASACAGEADSRAAPAEDGEDSATEGGPDPIELPEHLRCGGDTPKEDEPGLMQCSNGIVHREALLEASECPDCPPRIPSLYGSTSDACGDDADCPAGALCIASAELVEPRPDCTSTGQSLGQYQRYFACQMPRDVCGADSQCQAGETCAIVEGARECTLDVVCAIPGTPVPGRPFSIGAEARVAGVRASEDWCGPALGLPVTLDPRSRELAAGYWQAAALMEHASIASFARFTLQLLQLGAPLELTVESQKAMFDETDHARRCFALAARYGGRAVGPGVLEMAGAFAAESLSAIVTQTFNEGCVGETCAALQAAEALATATDEAVRETLEVITRDERRHAELAWRFVAWALEHDTTGEVRAAMQAEREHLRAETVAALHASAACADAESVSALSHHGILGAQRHAELRRAAMTQLVLPCVERLLATRGGIHMAPDARDLPRLGTVRPAAAPSRG